MAYTMLEQVKIRLNQFTSSDDEITFNTDEDVLLTQLLDQAELDVVNARKYPSSYTEDMIAADLENYETVMVNLAVYDRLKLGGDYQSTSTENSISRGWVEREKLLGSVLAIAHF